MAAVVVCSVVRTEKQMIGSNYNWASGVHLGYIIVNYNILSSIILTSSVRNREVLLEGSQIHRYGGAHARPGPGVCRFRTHSGPLSLCQDDINLIVTRFNAVFKFV